MAELTISAADIEGAIEDYVSSFSADTERVDDASEERVAHRHRQDIAGALDLLSLLDLLELAEDHGADAVLVEVQRQGVSEPLQTGIKAIDSMTPIGRGQRQLIIGDRKTGKTAVCVDTILNQREAWETGDPDQQVRCVYVAIGQKGTTIASVKRALEEGGAMEYTTIVAAPASDAAGFKWLAPYTGSAIGQHWMYDGKHVLIVFDDLTKQADAYRAISLLLRRPPGREAFPGDVFYLHSRLLER